MSEATQTAAKQAEKIIIVCWEQVLPGLNPRTEFPEGPMEELRASMRERGFDQAFPILARTHPEKPGAFQIACGERRWRAAGFEKIPQIPLIVRPMTDAQMLEVALVENIQRDNMNALDEARGYRMLLDCKDDEGKPMYTAESIAKKVGKSVRHVQDRAKLSRLLNSASGKALLAGQITPSHAELLANVPSERLREELLGKTLKNPYSPGLLPVEGLRDMIKLNYQVELRGAKFDLSDADLVPPILEEQTGERVSGGDCNSCPQNSRNVETEAKGSRFHLCMNPECFRAKTGASHEKWRQSVTDPAENRTALPAEENAMLFDESGERLRVDTKYVSLAEKPAADELKSDVDDAPVWKKLIKGKAVPVIVARDSRGKVWELVERPVALTAAKENQFEIFREKASRQAAPAPSSHVPLEKTVEETSKQKESEADAAKRVLLEQRTKEQERRTKLGVLIELHNNVAKEKRVTDQYWAVIAEPMVEAAEYFGGLMSVGLVLGFDRSVHGDKVEDLRDYVLTCIDEMPEQRLPAVILLLARAVICEERLAEWEKGAFKLFEVNPKEIAKKVAAAMKVEDDAKDLEEEIANGLKWSGNRTKAEEFNWDGGTRSKNPETCTVGLPGKLEAFVDVALDAKGWHVGWRIAPIGKKSIVDAPCASTLTAYGTRQLALRSGLLGLKQVIVNNAQSLKLKIEGQEAAKERVEIYIGKIEAPKEKAPAKAPPSKPAQKKGGKK